MDTSTYSILAGGETNRMFRALHAVIAGGQGNVILTNSEYAVIGGGQRNTIQTNADWGVIGGGSFNVITTNGQVATIGGGSNNVASGLCATVPGGHRNNADGDYSFAAGRRAKATNDGAFVWADNANADITSTNNNSVTMRAAGGYRLFSNSAATGGVFLPASGTSWAAISDRNVKKDFAPVDSLAILEKLAGIPITQWHYQWEDSGLTPHIGPMAQDFKAAFYPGRDDKSITTQESDGVALAAIQGLNHKLEQALAAKETQIEQLTSTVAELKTLVNEIRGANSRGPIAASNGHR